MSFAARPIPTVIVGVMTAPFDWDAVPNMGVPTATDQVVSQNSNPAGSMVSV